MISFFYVLVGLLLFLCFLIYSQGDKVFCSWTYKMSLAFFILFWILMCLIIILFWFPLLVFYLIKLGVDLSVGKGRVKGKKVK